MSASTSLTRHLYVAEEVEAALSYVCSGRNETQQAVFWCQELLHSGYGSETVSLLFRIWLWQKGSFGLRWLLDAVDHGGLAGTETTEDAILLATDRLRAMYALRDHSLWHLLVLETEPTDRLTTRPFPALSSLSTPLLHKKTSTLFFRACHQHKARTAWYLAQHYTTMEVIEHAQWWIDHLLPADLRPPVRRVCEILTEYPALLGYSSDEYDRVIRCLIVCILCMTTDALRRSLCIPRPSSLLPLPAPQMDPIAAHFLEDLAADVGCQRFRRFAIPSAALYGITARGRMPWTMDTRSQLNYFETHLAGCPYWDEMGVSALDALDELGRFTDESVYDVYLISEDPRANVPDEWTLSEKQKSHGEGVLSPTETVRIEKYIRTTLARCARLTWNTTENMLRILSTVIDHGNKKAPCPCDPEDILKTLRLAYSASASASASASTITPCRRKWIVHG